jgi:TPP-dependent pyruvate/acetoin dehydrogenase alpha subunit
LGEGLLTDGKIEQMISTIDKEIDEAFQFAWESPLPPGEDLHLYLFRE